MDVFFFREHEFSYKEGAFAGYNRAMRMRQSHRVKFDVLLTNYEIVNMDSTTLNSIDWAILCVDEAHRLKSQQSLVCYFLHFASRLFCCLVYIVIEKNFTSC